MTKGDKRRNRRRYKVRYDRLVVLLLVIAVLAVIITSCVKAVTGRDVTEDLESRLPQTPVTATDAADTAGPDSVETTTWADPWAEDTTLPEPEPVTEPEPAVPAGYKAEEHKADDIFMGDLVLVNGQYEYKFIEEDLELQTLYDHKNEFYDVSDNVTKADANVVGQINSMMEAFAKYKSRESSGIWVFDGYRTYNEQISRREDGRSSFEPGHTDYHSGRTVDMLIMNDDATTYYFSAEGEYEWFAENAAKYGFIVRFPQDKSDFTGERARPYTYRYVGAPHAQYINEHGLCLEEYIAELKAYTIDEPLKIYTDDGTYSVYYVPVPETGSIIVPVPEDEEYTVSGNNIDGFIVTVTE